MRNLRVENVPIEKIVPYHNNPRNNDNAVNAVASSIREFGFKVPVILDKDSVIIAGHTRVLAAKQLGMKTVPCIYALDLTDSQVRAFRLADNKVSELATWDIEKLSTEIEAIDDINMEDFGFDLDSIDTSVEIPDDDGWYGDERERTNNAYNLGLIDYSQMTNDFWQMPIIRNDGYIPKELIGFNYALSSKKKECGIHFYVDDYQFERVWNYPEKYYDTLAQYDCILSPDFSLYMDMPMPMKIWNVYRSRQIGQYYQRRGIKVIPTISWAEEETFSFCFQGIPKGSIVSISTVGVKEDEDALKIWHSGVSEMIRQLEPSTILIYGGKLEHDFKGIETLYFDNQVTERWKAVDKKNNEVI